MPLPIILLGLLLPRVLIAVLWFFSGWFAGVFQGWLIPLLGFFFLPYTMLWYTTVIKSFNGHWGFWQIVILALALLIDFSSMMKSRG